VIETVNPEDQSRHFVRVPTGTMWFSSHFICGGAALNISRRPAQAHCQNKYPPIGRFCTAYFQATAIEFTKSMFFLYRCPAGYRKNWYLYDDFSRLRVL